MHCLSDFSGGAAFQVLNDGYGEVDEECRVSCWSGLNVYWSGFDSKGGDDEGDALEELFQVVRGYVAVARGWLCGENGECADVGRPPRFVVGYHEFTQLADMGKVDGVGFASGHVGEELRVTLLQERERNGRQY